MDAGRRYEMMERALDLIVARRSDQPSLEELAAAAGLSPWAFERMFTRWAGITPRRFLQHVTLDHAKRRLAESQSVLDAAFDAGLSGGGRLHDLFVVHEAITPGEFKRRGGGVEIRWGAGPSPFGQALIYWTPRGLCGLAFATSAYDLLRNSRDMESRWPAAIFVEDKAGAENLAARIFAPVVEGRRLPPICLRGTNFQVQVWQALLRIPAGAVISYGDLARRMGCPNAARAVGAAVGRNPISWLIPCHRAILSTGGLRNYAWGQPRKLAMLGLEAAAPGFQPSENAATLDASNAA